MNSIMLTTTVILAFSLLIIGTSAECPPNPKQRAKECGDVFAQFGQKVHESEEALLQHCPEVYEALDCLRDIVTDCEMYQKLGLKMSNEQYAQMKRPIDNVCNKRKPLVVDKDEINKVLVQIGSVSYRVIFLAEFLSPDSGASDEIPDSNAAPVSNGTGEFPDLNTSETNELPNSNTTDIEEPASIPSPQCVQKMMTCQEIGKGMMNGTDYTQMCNKMGEIAECIDELLDSECGSTFPPEVTENLGMARSQYNTICSGGPPTSSNVLSPDSGAPDELPDSDSAPVPTGTNEFPDSNTPDIEEPAFIPSPQCVKEMMTCQEIGKGMIKGIEFTPMCNKLGEMTECIEKLLDSECGSTLPPEVTENLGMARSQYDTICSGGPPTSSNEKRDDSNMQGRPCPNIIANNCRHFMSTVSQFNSRTDTTLVCRAMGSYISCLEESYVDCVIPEGFNQFKNTYSAMCRTREASMQTFLDCKPKILHCDEMLNSIQDQSPASERCPKVMDVVECGVNLMRDCSIVSGVSEFKDYAQPLYQRCVAEGWDPPQMKRNVPGLSADEMRCSNLATECAMQVLELSDNETVCGGMSRFFSCMENVTEQCEGFTQQGVSLADNLSKAREDYNKMCGHVNSETVIGCVTRGQRCKQLSDGITSDSPADVRCPKVIAVIQCVQVLYTDCTAVLNFKHMIGDVTTLIDKCMNEGFTPGPSMYNSITDSNQGKRSVSKRRIGVFRCVLYFERCEKKYGQKSFDKIHEIEDCEVLDNNIRCNDEGIELCQHILPDYTGAKQKITDARALYDERCGNTEVLEGKRSVSKRRIDNFRCVLYFQRCARNYGQKSFDKIHEIEDCDVLDNNIRCNDDGIELCQHILPDYTGAKQKITDARAVFDERCGNTEVLEGKRSVSKRRIDNFRCVLYFQRCARNYGQKSFDKIHEIEDCDVLDNNIRCNDDGIELCQHILPDYTGAKQKITDARAVFDERCGNTEVLEGKRSVSKRRIDNFRCVLYFQRCARNYGQKSFDKIHEIEDCDVLDNNIRCNDDGIELCQHILPDYTGAKQKITDARAVFDERCGNTEVLEARAKRDLRSECMAMNQECVAMVGRFQFSNNLSVLCGDLNEMVGCMENVVNHCSSTLPNIESIRRKLTRAQTQVGSLCKMELPGGTLPPPTTEEAECRNIVQGCLGLYSYIDYSQDRALNCGYLHMIVGCFNIVVAKCRYVLPNTAQIEGNIRTAQRQLSSVCAKRSVSKRFLDAFQSNIAKRDLPSECMAMNQECVAMVGRFQFSSDVSVLCGSLNEMVGCMENVVNHCSSTLPNIETIRGQLVRAQTQVGSLCKMELPGGTLPTPTAIQEECMNMVQGCTSRFSSVDYNNDPGDTCNGLRSIVGCFQNLLKKCRRVLPNAAQIARNMQQAQGQVSVTCGYETGTGIDMVTSPPSTGGASVMECQSMNSKCLKILSGLSQNQNLQSICRVMNSTVDCFSVVLEKCGDTLPEIESIQIQMASARQQVAQACTSRKTVPVAPIEECQQMAGVCMGMMQNFSIGPNREQSCYEFQSVKSCMDNVNRQCPSAVVQIQQYMTGLEQQIAQICGGFGGETAVESKLVEGGTNQMNCHQKLQRCSTESSFISDTDCEGIISIIECIENVSKECPEVLSLALKEMYKMEKKADQCNSTGGGFGGESVVESKLAQGGTNQMKCYEELQKCSTESSIISDTDCEGMISMVECVRNVTMGCPGVFPPLVLKEIGKMEEKVSQCYNSTDEVEQVEEVDSAWCASQAQSCLNAISSFSVKNGMEATCSAFHNMVKCFDEVMDKCQSAISDFKKNTGQLLAMKEKITSACRKGGTGLVITPNSNQEKCMKKYKRCAGMMAKVPLHEDNSVMCPKLRWSMACIKKVTVECGSLLPESTKQQFANFEKLNTICPVGSYKANRGKFTEKCRNDIKVCDAKANGILNGDNIAKKDCRNGFRTLSCYRHVARECRLPKSNRKFFKHLKTILTNTCERRSTVKHTRGLIDFDIDWPWEDQDWSEDRDDSGEDAELFGDDDFELEGDFLFD